MEDITHGEQMLLSMICALASISGIDAGKFAKEWEQETKNPKYAEKFARSSAILALKDLEKFTKKKK